jgi:hypothetical protein
MSRDDDKPDKKDKKDKGERKGKPAAPRATAAEERAETAWPPLSDLEEEVSLICLRYFRGDWDLYLDYLGGPRVGGRQRGREMPVVEKLKIRDRQTDFLTAMLEDEVVAAAERFDFENLYRLWELVLALDPSADPFQKAGEQDQAQDFAAEEPPPSLH